MLRRAVEPLIALWYAHPDSHPLLEQLKTRTCKAIKLSDTKPLPSLLAVQSFLAV